MPNQTMLLPDQLAYNWPSALDVHYQELDDVPSYPNLTPFAAVETMDANTSWQNFMEQFRNDNGEYTF
jgi:hypothetical protein